MRRSYENLSLSRTQTGTTLGIGHPAMDRLLADAQAREAFIGIVEGLSEPLLVYTVRRKFDRAGERMRLAAIGIEGRQILQPAALLSRLSNLRPLTSTPQKRSIEANLLSCAASNLIDVVEDQETLLLQGILLPSEGHIADVMN